MFDAKYGFDEYGCPQHSCHFDTVSEQQQIVPDYAYTQVFNVLADREARAKAYNDSAARLGRLIEVLPPGKERDKAIEKARLYIAYAAEIRSADSTDSVREFYTQVAVDHMSAFEAVQTNLGVASEHIKCAERALELAGTL